MWSVFLSPGLWTGLAAAASGVLQASGHAPAAAVITDPGTASAVNTIFTAAMTLATIFTAPPKAK